MSTASILFAGLDVSSTDAWAAVAGQRPKRFPLSAAGAVQLVAWARQSCPNATLRCVMEHTGVYSMAWETLLRAQGATVAAINPARIRQFAMGSGMRSKTDKCNCRAILSYARHFEPAAAALRSPVQQRLAFLLRQKQKLEKQASALASRQHAMQFVPELGQLVADLYELEAQTLKQMQRKVEERIDAQIQSCPRLAEACRLMQSIPGIGPATAAELCAHLDAIMDRNAAQVTALAGLAPAQHQSGKRLGRARIDKQGIASLRKALYLAALSAGKHCPELAAMRARLHANGKAKKLTLIAIARKLLLMARAVSKSGQPYVRPA